MNALTNALMSVLCEKPYEHPYDSWGALKHLNSIMGVLNSIVSSVSIISKNKEIKGKFLNKHVFI